MLTRSLFLASMFALALPACGGQTDLAADDSSLADDEAKFDRTSGGSTGYFVIRRDMKRCAAPACGGDYVKRVNYSDIKCQDGKSGTNGECYVASVDYGKAGLTADESASFSGKSIIVKGTIAKQTINGKSWGNLV